MRLRGTFRVWAAISRNRGSSLAAARNLGAVERALSSGRHLVVAAGTRVGKSFAYLVPAILRAASPTTTRRCATAAE